MEKEFAEKYAHPLYKWIGERQYITNMQNWNISIYPGGIGFAFKEHYSGMALKVILKVHREDGICEYYLSDAYNCGYWGDNWQKWQTHRLPLFPYEGLHGKAANIKFSYILHKNERSIPSRYNYKFASLPEFERGWISNDDFHDSYFKDENQYTTYELGNNEVNRAFQRINNEYESLPIRPFFTRGNTWDTNHPIHEIHRQIDWVINRKREDPSNRHYINLAIFDFDNYHVAEHLIHAKNEGVEVECFADWAAVSSMNCTENIAKMRRSGIPIYGVVRNTPYNPDEGIASMHTKIIIFDGEIVHSSSYNLHFHLWGGNWENGLFYYSRDFAILYSNIYNAIRGSVIKPIYIDPNWRYNLFYSFGSYQISSNNYFRAQDAIIAEINNARHSIIISMFDIGYLTGKSIEDNFEIDVISAIINARNRGVKVRIIFNGMITHTGPLSETWDKDKYRPLKSALQHLKDAWIEVIFVYYWESVYSPLHHKFAVFDEHTVITESYNWYVASINSDEVLSVIRDSRIASEFIEEVNKICESFRLEYE